MKKWKRELFTRIEKLPARLRKRAYQLIDIDYDTPQGLSIRIAEAPDELEAAYSIAYKGQRALGVAPLAPSGMLLTAFHALPSTTTFIALVNDTPVASASIIQDSEIGLPADKVADLKPLRAPGRRLAELCMLSVDPETKHTKEQLKLLLAKACWQYSLKYLNIHTLVCSGLQDSVSTYAHIFQFKPLEASRRNAQAIVLSTHLPSLQNRLLQLHGDRPIEQSLYAFFAMTDHDDLIELPHREFNKLSDPVMTPSLLEYFFREKTRIFNSLSTQEFAFIERQYKPFPAYDAVFQEPTHSNVIAISRARAHTPEFTTDLRAKVALPGKLGPRTMTVTRASAHYIDVAAHPELIAGQHCRMKVWLSPTASAKLFAKIDAPNSDGSMRLTIQKDDLGWRKFLQFLTRDLEDLSHASSDDVAEPSRFAANARQKHLKESRAVASAGVLEIKRKAA